MKLLIFPYNLISNPVYFSAIKIFYVLYYIIFFRLFLMLCLQLILHYLACIRNGSIPLSYRL